METNTALDELTELRYSVRKAQHDLAATVAEARVSGASWADVGAQLGVSKQAAQQQYGDAVPNRYTCNCGWSNIIPTTPDRCREATDVVLAHIRAEHPEAGKGEQVATKLEVIADADTADAELDALDALGASVTTKHFYNRAIELGLKPEVEYKADSSQLIITINGPAPSRGWTMLSQFPGANGSNRSKHYFSRAGMRALPAKPVTRYDALRALEDYQR